MAATAVLDELGGGRIGSDRIGRPGAAGWAPVILRGGEWLRALVIEPAVAASGGALVAHGQGLMRGCLFAPGFGPPERVSAAQRALMACCRAHGVEPYPVAAGGFMCSPPYDVTEEALREGGRRLVAAVEQAAAQAWEDVDGQTSAVTLGSRGSAAARRRRKAEDG